MPDIKPFLPLSQALTVLPLGELGLSLSGTFLDYIGIEYFNIEIDENKGSITIETEITFINEVELGLPGVEDFSLVIGADEGISSFPFLFKFGNEFLISLTELRSLLRIPPALLVKAKHPEGSTDANEWVRDTESPYEIVLPPVSFSLDHNFNFDIDGTPSLSLPPAFIGDTGLVFEADGIQLFFDANATPPTGRPAGFKGLYVDTARLYLPPDFVLGEVTFSVTQAGIGNGGVFGRLALSWTNTLSEEEPFVTGPATGTFLDTPFALKEIALTLDQNIPTEASLKSELLLPFFNKAVTLAIHIEVDGNFSFTLGAAGTSSNSNLIQLDLPELLQITVESFTGEKKDDLGIFSIKGKLKPLLGGMDWPSFDVNQLSIDTDGNVEFDGGWVNIPESFTLDFNAFKIGISQFGFGTEGEEPEPQKQWIGLSGELTLVEGLDLKASVEGLKFSWLKEPDSSGDRDLEVSMTGVGVEFEIPNTLSFEGAVSYKKFDTPDPDTGLTGDLFKGNIKLNLMAVRLEIEAELMIGKLKDAEGHEFTTFFIVLGAELPAGLPLGATGTSLYGIKGLAAIHAGPTKTEEQNWYEWYLENPERNITSVKKWKPVYDEYGFGAGVTIGTVYDDGFTINMGVMLVVLIPGPVIILEGKANILKQRSDDKDEEGAFYLLAVLDGRAGTFMINIDVRYSLEDVITVGAGLEAFFDFNNSNNWYLHIGKKEPETKRIRAEILSLFKASAYFMIDSKSLLTGASVGLDIRETWGPVSFSLVAKISFDAAIFWKPLQLEGRLELYGELALKIFGIGIELFLQMLLEGKAPEPYWIHGLAKIGIKLFWPLPDLELEVEFTWEQPGEVQPVTPFLKECSFIHHKDSGATWALELTADDHPATALESVTILPVDARPVLTFARPVHNLKRHESGGIRFPVLSLASDEVGGKSLVYKIDELELQAWKPAGWNTVRTGINTGLDNEFAIDTDHILNLEEGQEPNEPQIALWRYHAADMANRYQREDFNDRHPPCNPKTRQEWKTVHWLGVPPNTRYDYQFDYADLHFVSDEESRGSPPRVSSSFMLHTPNVFIHFPEPVYQVAVQLTQESPDAHGYVMNDGISAGTMRKLGSVLFFRSRTPINAVRMEGRTLIISRIIYMTEKSVVEQIARSNDNHPNVQQQNINGELFLQPATWYRLKVATSVDVDKTLRSDTVETNYAYFRTDEGPGIPKLQDGLVGTPVSKELPYKDKPAQQFATYIERTFPKDGARNFYSGYDMGIQFNEAYLRTMYPNPIKMIIKDRNGKTLEASVGNLIDGFLPLMHLGLLVWLQGKENGGCARGPEPEISAPYLNFTTSLPFKANSLYTSEVVTNGSEGELQLHKFQFTTSRYNSFTQHILGSYEESRIKAIGLPSALSRRLADTRAFTGSLNTYNRFVSRFYSSEGALTKNKLLLEVQKTRETLNKESEKLFDTLDALMTRALSIVNMENRSVPTKFEVFHIPVNRAGKGLLILESPEPIDWLRINAQAVLGPHIRLELNFVWNHDLTRAFVFHNGGFIFSKGKYDVSFKFSGKPDPTSGVLLKNGFEINEEVNFSLEVS